MQKLLVSMSGGRTSAYMTKRLIDEFQDQYDMVICFANTGQESNETLDFVNNCDKHFGFNTVWLEADVKDGRVGTKYNVVDYETASRDGQPFEEVIKKYGLPNMNYPHCTRELKLSPIHSYIKSLGWKKGEYQTAIGIRTDEPKRISRKENPFNIIYPLVDLFPSDKQDVMQFWSEQEFDLQLQDYQGNCKWCYKKSNKKLFQIMEDDITVFEFPMKMEKLYGKVGPNQIMGIPTDQPRAMFRKYRTTKMMIDLFNETNYKQLSFVFDDDEDSGCSESCEAFGD